MPKISAGKIAKSDKKPVAASESSFSDEHWNKLVKLHKKEKGLLGKLKITKDDRKAPK